MIFYILIQNIREAIHTIHTEMKIKEAHRPSDLAKFQQDEMDKKERAKSRLVPGGQRAKETHHQMAELTAFSCCFKSPRLSSSESYIIQIHTV